MLERFLASTPASSPRHEARLPPPPGTHSHRLPVAASPRHTVKYRWPALRAERQLRQLPRGTAGRRALRSPGGDDPFARGTAARRGAEGGALLGATPTTSASPQGSAPGAPRRLPALCCLYRGRGGEQRCWRSDRGKPLRAPTPRQLDWKAIQQAQLQGLSTGTARLLGISRVTVSNYVRASLDAGTTLRHPPAALAHCKVSVLGHHEGSDMGLDQFRSRVDSQRNRRHGSCWYGIQYQHSSTVQVKRGAAYQRSGISAARTT